MIQQTQSILNLIAKRDLDDDGKIQFHFIYFEFYQFILL